VEWMQQYGIDVVALQRFSSSVSPGSTKKAHKDGIALKIKNACQTYGRKFYIMYDISGMAMDNSFVGILQNDWNNTITSPSALNLLASPNYAKEIVDGVLKPVVCIWGVGSEGRPGDNTSWTTIINWFKSQGCYVIVGGIKDWRTSTTCKGAFESANMISPWSVGSFGATSIDTWANIIKDDMLRCKDLGIDYMPVLWPGFSWANWKVGYETRQNQHPRMHGNYMWDQFYRAKVKCNEAGITATTYVAMFDEYDEGTAIAKAAENASMIPNNQWFLTLDADGVVCSSDFYLRLVGDAAKMIKGIIPLTTTHPTIHNAPLSAVEKIHNDDKTFNIFPNPLTSNSLSINMHGFSDMRNVQVEIVNIMGQTVFKKAVDYTTSLKVDTSGLLNESVYLVTIAGGQSKIAKKLIVKNIVSFN